MFRQHPKLLLTSVPTLMQWGTVSRLCIYNMSSIAWWQSGDAVIFIM